MSEHEIIVNKHLPVEFIRGVLMSAVNAAEYVKAGNLDDLRQGCQSARRVLAKLAAVIGNGNGSGPTEVDRDLAIVKRGLTDWDMAEAGLEALWRL